MTSLSSLPKPDFIDHFPILAPGHGARPRPPRPGRRGQKPCSEGTCQLNRAVGGAKHYASRADNAGEWMKAVSYNGPFPGITPREERERREDIINPRARCHKSCRRQDIHSVCLSEQPQKASLGEMMSERVMALRHTSHRQSERRLAEYLGVEVTWRGEKKGRAA